MNFLRRSWISLRELGWRLPRALNIFDQGDRDFAVRPDRNGHCKIGFTPHKHLQGVAGADKIISLRVGRRLIGARGLTRWRGAGYRLWHSADSVRGVVVSLASPGALLVAVAAASQGVTASSPRLKKTAPRLIRIKPSDAASSSRECISRSPVSLPLFLASLVRQPDGGRNASNSLKT